MWRMIKKLKQNTLIVLIQQAAKIEKTIKKRPTYFKQHTYLNCINTKYHIPHSTMMCFEIIEH